MGTGVTVDGVKIRDNANPAYFATVNPDGTLSVSPGVSAKFTIQQQTVTAVPTQAVVAVGAAEVLLLATNSNRIDALIQNKDATELALYFASGTAFVSAPLVLPQYGSFNAAQTNGVYRGAIYARRAAATGNVGVVEET